MIGTLDVFNWENLNAPELSVAHRKSTFGSPFYAPRSLERGKRRKKERKI